MLTKDKVKELVDHMPETFSVDDLVERVIMLQKIELAQEEIDNGEGIDWEDVKKRDGYVARIVFSKIAKFDLREIIEYIKRDSIKYARLERKKIVEAIDKLETEPYLGRVVPELNDNNTREFIFRNYRIIYRIAPKDQINILSIHHHSRLLSNNPAFKDEV